MSLRWGIHTHSPGHRDAMDPWYPESPVCQYYPETLQMLGTCSTAEVPVKSSCPAKSGAAANSRAQRMSCFMVGNITGRRRGSHCSGTLESRSKKTSGTPCNGNTSVSEKQTDAQENQREAQRQALSAGSNVLCCLARDCQREASLLSRGAQHPAHVVVELPGQPLLEGASLPILADGPNRAQKTKGEKKKKTTSVDDFSLKDHLLLRFKTAAYYITPELRREHPPPCPHSLQIGSACDLPGTRQWDVNNHTGTNTIHEILYGSPVALPIDATPASRPSLPKDLAYAAIPSLQLVAATSANTHIILSHDDLSLQIPSMS